MKHNPGFLKVAEAAKRQVKECTPHEVQARRARGEKFLFIDVREESEFAAGRPQGAIHLGRGILERDIETVVPDPNTEIVLSCGGGYRSALAAVSLKEMGYTHVVSMDGGIRAWREAGLPEDQGS